MDFQGSQITQLPGALITDVGINAQPEGTHRYALNTVPETNSGDQGFVSNEPGNSQCLNLGNYKVVGSIALTNNENILFLTNGTLSKISLQQNCTLTTVVDAECLNFSDLHPVTGVAKIRKGCNRVIYFRDSYNSDRSIDIDEILNNPVDNRYYNGTWHCELFKLAPDFDFPCLDYITTNNSGGSLKLGTYQFGIALGDEDLNFSGVLTVTQPIPIISGSLGADTNALEGGDPAFESPTTKSINLQVSNLDQDFQYIKFYVIESIGGVVTPYEADTLAISGTTLNYTYRGINYNTAIPIDISVINVPRIVYDKSKTMEQQDNRLLRANLQERTINNSVFQRAANLIKTRYVTKPIKYLGNSSVFSGDYYVDNRSYMRDEVYALAISGVYGDGTETPKYHIPGRLIDTSSTGVTLPTNTDPFAQNGTKQHNRKDPINGWDSTTYTVIDTETFPYVSGNVQDWNTLLSGGSYITLGPTQLGLEDAVPVNGNIGDELARWKVYNTAYIDEQNTVYDSYYSKGQTSYWESEFEYPDTLDCSSNRIYPTGRIRHHKMPDTTLEPHFISVSGFTDSSDAYILSLGLEFDLQDFIAFLQTNLGSEFNEITGFKIARAKRDRGNKSVLDKGISNRMMEMLYHKTDEQPFTEYLFQSSLFNKHAEINRNLFSMRFKDFGVPFDQVSSVLPDENTFDSSRSGAGQTAKIRHSYQYLDTHNPKSQFSKDSEYQFVKMEKELFGKYEYWGNVNSWVPNDNSRASFRCVYTNYHTNPAYKGTPNPYFTNRARLTSAFVTANENITFDSRRVIGKTKQESLLSKIGNYPDISADNINYGGSPIELDGSKYGTEINIEAVTPPSINDYYSKAYYISLKNYNPAQYGQLNGLTYYDINTCLISPSATVETLFGGDIFISQVSFRKTYTDDDFIDAYGDERTWWAALSSYFVESEVNCKLRHEGYDGSPAQWYYPYRGTNLAQIEDVIFINDETLIEDNSIDVIIDNYVQGNYCFNQYNYNEDYSRQQELQPKFPLYLGYDYCSTCLNEYPTRIAFSEKSYQEEIFDNYRRFLPNNYRDVQANTGEIQNVFKESDNLYIRTLHSLWFVPSKYQNLETTGGTINIGTGELFSIPPKELTSVRSGYNGGQTTLDLIINQYGAFYADTGSGIVFQLGGEQQQVEISKTGGNRIWFQNNLPFNLLKFYPDFPNLDAPTSKIGIGLVGYYDPEFRRYILTKKDYYPIYPDTTTFIENVSTWLIGVNGKFIEVTDPYNSPDYFENKSWTISYYLESKKWVGWHSYLPNYAWNNLNTFYSNIQTNSYLWEHNTGEYTTYYGNKYPHIIEYIVTKDETTTKVSNSLVYISDVSQYNPTYGFWKEVKNSTFTQALFYNSEQSTGILDLTIKNNTDPFASVLGTFDPSTILVEKTESNWAINNIRDMVDQTNPEQPIFSTNWTDIQSTYPIDKVPNMNVINYLTKSQFEMEPLRDSFMASRLIFKPVENHRITTKYLSNKYNISFR